ncbi:MAG: hypothetical protein R3E32_16610 [Chitinophagales bacterium]
MSEINDIYEWMELYLLGQLKEKDLEKFEEKLTKCKDFAADLHMMEIEMYEDDLLPIERKRMFEDRLKNDEELAKEFAIYIASFEIAKFFDNQGNCKHPSFEYQQPLPNKNLPTVKNILLTFCQSIWKRFVYLFSSLLPQQKIEE